MFDEIRKFADSTNFANAIKVTIASAVPFIIFAYLGETAIGFTLAIGAILTYPADIPSHLSHKIKGVIIGAIIVAGCNLLVNVLFPHPGVFFPVILVALFFLSMISVYGHRANMISFSGLLSVCLSVGQLHPGVDVLAHAGLILCGGLFYLLISLVFHFISPHRYTELQIAECMRLTAKYLKLRGDLWNSDANRQKIIEKQLHLQVELNAIHENIREMLIRNRPTTGNSAQNRKMLLVFISLVEIMELALSTSFDHNKLHTKFNAQPKVLGTYQTLAYSLASTLKQLSKTITHSRKYVAKHSLTGNLNQLERAIREYENSATDTDIAEGVLMLTNMMHYAEKQIEKIKVIRRAFTSEVDLKDLRGRDKDLEKFLSPVYYPLTTLKENLSFSSTIFRHSLRLTITILIAFVIGTVFRLENVYWILLTIVVIMRPGYGLTKERSLQRIWGTIAGAIIAFAIISIVHNPVVIGAFIVVCILLGFAFTTTNYTVGVTFVTMYVVFLYGILDPNINDVIRFRIIDTVIGAALAFGANYLFWPLWEFLNVPLHLKKSVEANRDYLKEISELYNKKGDVTTSYRLARKNAFIEIGNLMASYQRMSQEPKSKQKQIPQVYKLVVLNHTLLSAAASLGTYIQSHKTTKASEAFNVVVGTVIRHLENTIRLLDTDLSEEVEQLQHSEELAMRFTELRNIRVKEMQQTGMAEDTEYDAKMQEAQLVIEQLVWLTNLSEKIEKLSKELHLARYQ
ncbi:MAG TPA: FUSC family membrane protein [Flavobacterium sp.]|jgi:uncharacterized membrane protein (TIGR01666 family)